MTLIQTRRKKMPMQWESEMGEKYIVFKRKHWEQFLIDMATPALRADTGRKLNALCEGEVADGVVIRRQDAFAPPALDAYSNAITVALNVLSEADGGADIYDAEIPKRLREIADYFHGQAALSWDAHRKLPD